MPPGDGAHSVSESRDGPLEVFGLKMVFYEEHLRPKYLHLSPADEKRQGKGESVSRSQMVCVAPGSIFIHMSFLFSLFSIIIFREK